jgi:hypothetical protein
MSFKRHTHTLKAAFLSIAVVGTVALASSLTLPFTFSAGTTARASEVNANFSAVKTAVDDNAARVTALEARVTAIEAALTALGTMPSYTAPTLQTGWSNVYNNFAPSGFLKDNQGFVHLRGLVKKSASSTNTIIFNLPVGYRPSALLQFPARCGNDTMCFLHIWPSGDIQYGGGATSDATGSLTLDEVIFDPR